MKFFTKVFALTVAATTFAADINIPNVDTSACDAALDKLEVDCNANSKDFDSMCKVWNNPKCNKIFKSGIASIPECESIPQEYLQMFDAMFKVVADTVGFSCEYDEGDNLCPLSKLSQELALKNQKANKDETIKAINESCGSKKCREAFVDYFNEYQALPEAKEYLEILNAETCVTTANNAKIPAKASSSDAITVKATGAFVVMIGLLLNTLL